MVVMVVLVAFKVLVAAAVVAPVDVIVIVVALVAVVGCCEGREGRSCVDVGPLSSAATPAAAVCRQHRSVALSVGLQMCAPMTIDPFNDEHAARY